MAFLVMVPCNSNAVSFLHFRPQKYRGQNCKHHLKLERSLNGISRSNCCCMVMLTFIDWCCTQVMVQKRQTFHQPFMSPRQMCFTSKCSIIRFSISNVHPPFVCSLFSSYRGKENTTLIDMRSLDMRSQPCLDMRSTLSSNDITSWSTW